MKKLLLTAFFIVFLFSAFTGCIKYRKHGLVEKYDVSEELGGFKGFEFGESMEEVIGKMDTIPEAGLDSLMPPTAFGFYYDMLDEDGLPEGKMQIAAPVDTILLQSISYYGGTVFGQRVHLRRFSFVNDRLSEMSYSFFLTGEDALKQAEGIANSLKQRYGKPHKVEKRFEEIPAYEWLIKDENNRSLSVINYKCVTGEERLIADLSLRSLQIYKILHNRMVEKHLNLGSE